jgi:hypothetical protein
MMTDSDWLAHWVSAAPTLSTEVLETIATAMEDEEQEEPLGAVAA